MQQPQIYMNTLLVMHAVNISLSLLLIVGWPAVGIPTMGVVGAGIGTSVSIWVWPDRCCLPRHSKRFEPSFLDLSSIA